MPPSKRTRSAKSWSTSIAEHPARENAGVGTPETPDGETADPETADPADRGTPDLAESRRRIDALDDQLVAVLAARARVVADVVRYKRTRHMRVVDRAREDDMLAAIGDLAASRGLDPRIARQVLRAVIDGFTLLEVEELGPDLEDPAQSPDRR